MAYDRDILDEFADSRRAPTYRVVEVSIGMVVEHRASGYCGDVVKWTSEAVTLRDRRGQQRHFGWPAGGFLLEGRPVTLRRPAARRQAGPTDRITTSGSIAGSPQAARVAVGNRIWVEGRHDAELLELVWGDELREAGVVVEPLHGIDDLAGAVASFRPSPSRRLGVLVDHLVPGSKEQRIAAAVVDPNVLVTGHPFVDVWAGIRPSVVGIEAWPDIPRAVPWKEGMCAALGIDLATFWPKLRNRVKTYADLRPELVGAVEQLLDFVTQDKGRAKPLPRRTPTGMALRSSEQAHSTSPPKASVTVTAGHAVPDPTLPHCLRRPGCDPAGGSATSHFKSTNRCAVGGAEPVAGW